MHPSSTSRRRFLATASALAFATVAARARATAATPLVVHTHTSDATAWHVNSLIVESRDALLIVDAQLHARDAVEVARRARALGKPVAAVLVTHPHKDHFGGLAALRRRLGGVPVLANATTRRVLELDTLARATALGTEADLGWLPEAALVPGDTIDLGDTHVVVDEFVDHEAHRLVALYAPATGDLLAGDLIYAGSHAWLGEGRTAGWIDALLAAQHRWPGVARVHAGHGATRDGDPIAIQMDYLVATRHAVGMAMGADGRVDAAGIARIAATLERQFPHLGLGQLVPGNVRAVARELAAGG
ncbi:MAG: MBL fold metallo-hydrolase [Burkholderiales bacterium]|jgi:glyoxylase-like metal-dependent hydrolase (beta-lactamase superfamily II)|nr:MBL fold metallo-hydrolase [Burkholderiales bacterium]